MRSPAAGAQDHSDNPDHYGSYSLLPGEDRCPYFVSAHRFGYLRDAKAKREAADTPKVVEFPEWIVTLRSVLALATPDAEGRVKFNGDKARMLDLIDRALKSYV